MVRRNVPAPAAVVDTAESVGKSKTQGSATRCPIARKPDLRLSRLDSAKLLMSARYSVGSASAERTFMREMEMETVDFSVNYIPIRHIHYAK